MEEGAEALHGMIFVARPLEPSPDDRIHGPGHVGFDPLLEQSHAAAGFIDHRSTIRLHFSGQNFQQSRFARAVPTQETDAFTPLDVQGGVVQEYVAPVRHFKILCTDEGHGVGSRSGWRADEGRRNVTQCNLHPSLRGTNVVWRSVVCHEGHGSGRGEGGDGSPGHLL